MYKKRAGSSGLLSQLYEIKLICLLNFRAFFDTDIEEFQIGSNVENLGRFDDICFKTKVKGFNKPISAFIQVNHKENKKQTLKIDLLTYFISYLEIRQNFDPNKKDLFFNSTYDDTECLFVIYTTARMDWTASLASDVPVKSGFSAKLNDLIGTGGTITRPNWQEDFKSLCEVAMKQDMTFLAKRIANFVNDDSNFQSLLTDRTVQRFHVILAQKVVDVSDIQPDGYRIASFRHDFFHTQEEYLSIFKGTLFTEILKKSRIIRADLDHLLSEFLTEPTDALKLSKLIGTVITYENGMLELNKQITTTHKPDLQKMNVPRSTVDKAVEIAAREILSFLHFKVPAAFGNKDLTIRGNDTKTERRITYLVSNFIDLLAKCKSSNIVTIDNSLDSGFLQLNGGIAGAIGNIFVLDENPKLMKITDNWEQLGPLAKRLYSKLNSAIHNMHEYKFSFKISNFPTLSFECDNYAEDLARDFLNRLLFYSNQANDNDVEEILKMEIENCQLDQAKYFEAKTEAMFLRYYHQIQKWWMKPECAAYLTRETNIFLNSINPIVADWLMKTINIISKRNIKQYNYTFTKDAVSTLNLQDHCYTIISAENSVLAVIKVMQHLKDKDHIVIHWDYIDKLTTNDCYVLRRELKYTNFDKVLIIVCNDIQQVFENKQQGKNTILEMIAVRPNNTIIVTNDTPFQILRNYFPNARTFLNDEKIRLIDLSEESQKRIFETATAAFPGVEIRLDLFLRGWTKPGSRLAYGAPVTSAAADSGTGTGSQRTGDEERKVPGTS